MILNFKTIAKEKLIFNLGLFLGLFFVFWFQLHIVDMFFIHPKSTVLLWGSFISLMTPVIYILKHQRLQINKKLRYCAYALMSIVTLSAIASLLTEIHIIEKDVLRFRFLELNFAILLLLHIIFHAFHLDTFNSLYTYVANNKKHVLICAMLSMPFILILLSVYPNMSNLTGDGIYQQNQAYGVALLHNWQPVFITMLFRLSLLFQMDASGGVFLLQEIILLLSCYLISIRLFKNKYISIIVFIFLLYNPFTMVMLLNMTKDALGSVFILLLFAIFAYNEENRNYKKLIWGILTIYIIALSKPPQIFVAIPLFALYYFTHKKTSRREKVFATACFVLFAVLGFKALSSQVFKRDPFMYTKGYDRARFKLDGKENLTKKESKSKKIAEIKKSYMKYSIQPATPDRARKMFSILKPMRKYHDNMTNIQWIQMVLDNFGTFIKYRVETFQTFRLSDTDAYFIYHIHHHLNTADGIRFGNPKYNFIHVKILRWVNITFKYILDLNLILLAISLWFNNLKLLPNLNNRNKFMSLSYYCSMISLIYFFFIIIITPFGVENRYLLDCDILVLLSGLFMFKYFHDLYIKRKTAIA